MKSVTLLGRLTTGVVISGLLMLGISSCTDKNVVVTGNPTTKQVEVVTTIETGTTATQTPAVQTNISSGTTASTAALATQGIVMPSLPTGTVANATLTNNLTNSVVVPAITFTAPAGSSLHINTSNVPVTSVGFQLSSVVGTSGGGTVPMSTNNNIIPVSSAANGSSITTSSSAVIPAGVNTLTLGAVQDGTFVAGGNSTAIAPLELTEENSTLNATRQLTNRVKIFLTGVVIKFNNNTSTVGGVPVEKSTLPNKQAWVIAREQNTGIGTTLGSKLTLDWNGTNKLPPADGMVTMTMNFYNSLTNTSVVKVKTVPVLANRCVITDDEGTYPQFTHFSFILDLRDVKN
ncbi:MAG: hypothetical protein WCO98_09605 [bacterium]